MASSIQVLSIVSKDESGLALHQFLSGLQGISLAAEASNDAEALQKLNEMHTDVVLLDLSVREIDAMRLIRDIRRLHPTVRVLIATSFRRSTDIFAALEAGADGYVLKQNNKGLEAAISTVRLGAVWLDPGIATQVLEVIASQTSIGAADLRTLPTGRIPIPLFPHEKDLLSKVATSSCADGVCMVDPSFLKKLRAYAPQRRSSDTMDRL